MQVPLNKDSVVKYVLCGWPAPNLIYCVGAYRGTNNKTRILGVGVNTNFNLTSKH